MARFWKPRHLPAVKWNPKKNEPYFEFTPEGFFDTENPKLIEYMKKCGYYLLNAREMANSEVFIAEQMKNRGMDQSGFVRSVPMPDESEMNPENFQPVAGELEDAPHPVPKVDAKPGGESNRGLPSIEDDFDDDDFEPVEKKPAKKTTKKTTAKRTVKRRTTKKE